MRRALPFLLLALAVSALGCARAQVAPVAGAGEAPGPEHPGPEHPGPEHPGPEHWAGAAAASADPLAPRLATYLRLIEDRAGAVDPAVAARFLADNPTWPNRVLIGKRLSDGIAAAGSDAVVLPLCAQAGTAAARLRCAEAQARAGQGEAAARSAQAAWESGLDDPAAEAAFLSAWSGVLTPASQGARFERIVGGDRAAAQRQAARLEPAARQVAEARLALRRDDPGAAALVAALPDAGRHDPGLVLDLARFLRRGDASGVAALAEWRADGVAAETASAPERRGGFRTEREMLARRLLRTGDAAGALGLMQDEIAVAGKDGSDATDAEFLAGWIALRRMGDPAGAAGHFSALLSGSRAALSQSRGHYWMGRTAAARGDSAGAREEYGAAAAWPVTFYGQLGAIAADGMGGRDGEAGLRARLAALRDPEWTAEEALAFSGGELARAGELLVAWGEAGRARAFLLRLDEVAPDARARALAAALGFRLGVAEAAVTAARMAGRAGGMLPVSGWPVQAPETGSEVERAVVLGIVRQESSFDAEAVSPSGARGLMQLMPATAREVARGLGVAESTAALTADPGMNVRLGSAYLAGLLGRSGGVLPYAAAAYNAGPGRLREWLGVGDPAADGGDMVDWIEMIPVGETRNYVQRVIENVVDYRARLGVVAPHPLARWLG